jgi:hypothetical protein
MFGGNKGGRFLNPSSIHSNYGGYSIYGDLPSPRSNDPNSKNFNFYPYLHSMMVSSETVDDILEDVDWAIHLKFIDTLREEYSVGLF